MHKTVQTHENFSSRILVLDGLRFLAAFSVMCAHYVNWVVVDQGIQNPLTSLITSLSGMGMPLFFVLSGFVIHYNYHQLREKPDGIKAFLVARFTRLYPLYITLFVIEFITCFHLWRGSAGHAGERWGFLLALPYYLTLTQDWFFGIIARNNLLYQYFMVSAVSWSISLEVFFYLSYLFFARWLNKQKNTLPQIIYLIFAQGTVIFLLSCFYKHEKTIEHVALVGFGELATMQHGYQDSLMRWLNYFNPIVNLPAFFFGLILANLYLNKRDKPLRPFEKAYGGWLSALSLIAAFSLHFFLFNWLAPTNSFVGRTASILNVPFIAAIIFCLTRYPSSISKVFSSSVFVKLGEASYSIYLLHAFFGWYSRDFYYLKLNPWLLYLLAMACILVISRCSFLLFEKPAQSWLRKKMLGQRKSPPLPHPLAESRASQTH